MFQCLCGSLNKFIAYMTVNKRIGIIGRVETDKNVKLIGNFVGRGVD